MLESLVTGTVYGIVVLKPIRTVRRQNKPSAYARPRCARPLGLARVLRLVNNAIAHLMVGSTARPVDDDGRRAAISGPLGMDRFTATQ